MKNIRIRNLRSLEDTGKVDLSPLVVLLGKNSSGKSTFLRTFPLLKQSILTPITEPILWYSEKSVDFGNFETSINKNRNVPDEPISFDFEFETELSPYYFSSRQNIDKKTEFKLHVEVLKKNFKKIIIKTCNLTFEITATKSEETAPESFVLLINNKPLNLKFSQETNNSFYGRNFLPNMIPELDKNIVRNNILTRHSGGIFISYISHEIKKLVLPYYMKLIEKNSDKYSEIIYANEQFEMSKDNQFSQHLDMFLSELEMNLLEDIGDKNYSYFNKIQERFNYSNNRLRRVNIEETIVENMFLEALQIAPDDVKNEVNLLLLSSFWTQIVDICNEYLTNYFSNVHYIAPVRASAQRYYRTQGLAVGEIDPQGENIPMAINNMLPEEEKKFRKWTKKNFDFEIYTEEEGGHVSLQIQFVNGDVMNLTDTGFGFSQILPIILLIWRANEGVSNNESARIINSVLHFRQQYPTTIVIEQPELHLHPHLQSKLCQVLAKCVTYENSKTRIIIETHSETIINKLGQLIFEESLKSSQVNIVAFGLTKVESEKSVKNIPFNSEGILEQWPVDFLMEDF